LPLRLWLDALVLLAALVSVVTDLRFRKIPDWVTLPAVGLALGLRLWREGLGDFDTGVLSGLLGAAIGAAVFGGIAWARKGLGWGDVKLMVAVGAAFGYPLTLAALLFVSLAGALQAIVVVIWQRAVFDTARQLFSRWSKAGEPRTERHIPYGVAIALGSVWAMWWDGLGTK
jgi:prepilin peptidase CpaA